MQRWLRGICLPEIDRLSGSVGRIAIATLRACHSCARHDECGSRTARLSVTISLHITTAVPPSGGRGSLTRSCARHTITTLLASAVRNLVFATDVNHAVGHGPFVSYPSVHHRALREYRKRPLLACRQDPSAGTLAVTIRRWYNLFSSALFGNLTTKFSVFCFTSSGFRTCA